jgi:hypothetical protein
MKYKLTFLTILLFSLILQLDAQSLKDSIDFMSGEKPDQKLIDKDINLQDTNELSDSIVRPVKKTFQKQIYSSDSKPIVVKIKPESYTQHFFGIEAALAFLGSDVSDQDNIRGDMPSNEEWEPSSSVTSILYRQFVGIKYENMSLYNKMGISTGIGYCQQYGILGSSDYWENSDFFYLLYREDGLNTEYFKISGITQTTDYIRVPLEIRFFPYQANFLRIYFKAGLDFNYRLETSTKVDFANAGMNQYEDEVVAMFEKPKQYYSSGYFGGGLRFGKPNHMMINIEALLPVFSINQNATGLVDGAAGVGCLVNVQLPLNKIPVRGGKNEIENR